MNPTEFINILIKDDVCDKLGNYIKKYQEDIIISDELKPQSQSKTFPKFTVSFNEFATEKIINEIKYVLLNHISLLLFSKPYRSKYKFYQQHNKTSHLDLF